MNIENIYKAVEEDEMNSPLVSICYALEQQGYRIILEGVDVTSADLEDELFQDFERCTNEFSIELIRNNRTEQKLKLVFTDFHEFSFQQAA